MGFRVGERVGNTYVSTNGRNVRATTKVSKNVYYTSQFGHKKNHKSSVGVGFFGWLFIITLPLFVFNCFMSTLGLSELVIGLDDILALLNIFGIGINVSHIGIWIISLIIGMYATCKLLK
jgi:hypothetical protein